MRKYDEEGGRFTSIDPLWESDRSGTPYSYTASDPVNYVDPAGTQRNHREMEFNPMRGGGNSSSIIDGGPSGAMSSRLFDRLFRSSTSGGRAGGASSPSNGGRASNGGAPLKQLSQFNSAESLVNPKGPSGPHLGVGSTNRAGTRIQQGKVQGDGDAIYKAITRGGTPTASGGFRMPSGAIIHRHAATSTGVYTIDVNLGNVVYKIRVTQ